MHASAFELEEARGDVHEGAEELGERYEEEPPVALPEGAEVGAPGARGGRTGGMPVAGESGVRAAAGEGGEGAAGGVAVEGGGVEKAFVGFGGFGWAV